MTHEIDMPDNITNHEPAPTLQPVTTQTVNPPPATPPPAQPPPTKDNLDTAQAADTFKALNQLFDESPAATAPVNPVVDPASTAPTTTPPGQVEEKAPEPTPVGTDLQKQLDAIKAPEGAHPNLTAGIEQAKKLAASEGQRAQEFQAKLQDLEQKVQTYETQLKEQKLPEPVEKELTELRNFRREIDMTRDPEFVKNFVQPVQTAEQEMMTMLKQVGVTDETLKFIQENGGVIAVSQSQEKANDKQTLSEWLDTSILGRINTVARNRIIAKLGSATDVLDRGQRELADWRENGQKRYEARMQKITEEFNSGRDEAIRALGDLVKPAEITASMDATARQEAEAHNALLKEAEDTYANYMKVSQQPKTAGEILVKATQANMLLKMFNAEKAKTADLQARLDRIKASGQHSAAGDHTPPVQKEQPTLKDLLKKPTDEAMNELFNKAGVPR